MSRTCEVELLFNKTVCDQLGTGSDEGREIESLVQPHASIIIMAKSLISYILPAILSVFLGPWSDLNGRRLLLLAPLFGIFRIFIMKRIKPFIDNFSKYFLGSTLMYTMLAIFSEIPNLHPGYLMLTAIPLALTGGFICPVAGAYCYISDTTREEDRSAR